MISERLKAIADMVDSCECCADIGTDHGYIPIYLLNKGVCKRAIASDINKGPLEKAKYNVKKEDLSDKIDCRLGSGFSTIKPGEQNIAIIAGMGGNLTRDIIEDGMEVFKSLDYLIVQPVQNVEVFRQYVYEKGYEIIEENLCIDEGKYYEIIKIKYKNKKQGIQDIDDIFYEISKFSYDRKHKLINEFIKNKIEKYEKILYAIKEDSESALERKKHIIDKINKLKELKM